MKQASTGHSNLARETEEQEGKREVTTVSREDARALAKRILEERRRVFEVLAK